MTEKSLIKRDPETLIQKAEDWADMPKDALKRRAAEASQSDDRDELQSLLTAYTLIFSKNKSRTSPRTLQTYWEGARRLLDWCAGKGIKPHQIEEEHAHRFINSLSVLSAKSGQVYLTAARSMHAALVWAKLAHGNPFEGISISDPTPRAQKADPYDADEIKKMLAVANDRECALILLACDSGLRVEEITNLEWENIDFEYKQIRDFLGKGQKRATVDMTNRLTESLQSLKPRAAGNIFHLKKRRIQQLLEKVCKHADVRFRGFHSLRHSCGTRLYTSTNNLLIVQKHLRHADISTSTIYVQLSEDAVRNGIDKMEELDGI